MKSIEGGQTDILTLKVLVVDDSEADFSALKTLFAKLRSSKYDLDWASAHDEGLERLTNGSYDVCLLDYSIDDDGGFTFLRSAQKLAPAVPIILLSQGLSLDRDVQALRLGAADYLSKSRLQAGFLHRSIRYALERRKSRNQAIRIERHLSLAQKMNSLGELAFGMAHDLRDSLAIVQAELKSLHKELSHKKTCSNSIQKAQEGCRTAERTIEHILVCADQNIQDIQSVDLETLLTNTITDLDLSISNDTKLELELGQTTIPSINGNPKQIQQVLMNLVLNAQEMMPRGGTINCSLAISQVESAPAMRPEARPGEYVTLSIHDTGIGIPADHLDRLFDPLFSTKQKGNMLGLGLPAVAAIMKNHSGWIEINSILNEGTTAILYFPTFQTEESVIAGRVEQDITNSSIQTSHKCKGKVLVIDEQEDLGELITLYLAAAGFDSKYFSRPEHAIDWFEKHAEEIDLVVLDARLSRMNSKDCFLALAKISPDVKVVICDQDYTDSTEDLLTAGALKYFQKPNRYPTLVTWVQETLGSDD